MAIEKAQTGRPRQSQQPGAVTSSQEELPLALGECVDPLPYVKRNPRYLEFIRSRPCAFCAHPATEPHHTFKTLRGVCAAGMAQKGSDWLTIPVCRRHHKMIHSSPFKPSREELLELITTYLIVFLDLHREKLLA